MDSRQVLRTALVAAWCVVCLSRAASADAKTEKSISEALADADRYAGGYNDAYVAGAWERASDGWVRGGYTLVSGDVHTDVRYVVDPSGEMRVMARRPGPGGVAAPAADMSSATATAVQHHVIGSPLLGGYRPPYYQRLVHFGSLTDDDDDVFDDVDLDLDLDDHVDDEEPFFFDVVPDNWNAAAPVDEWVRLSQAETGAVRRGPDGPVLRVDCKSSKCHRAKHRARVGMRTRPPAPVDAQQQANGAGDPSRPAAPTTAPTATPNVDTRDAQDAVGAASFQSSHYDVRLRTMKQ